MICLIWSVMSSRIERERALSSTSSECRSCLGFNLKKWCVFDLSHPRQGKCCNRDEESFSCGLDFNIACSSVLTDLDLNNPSNGKMILCPSFKSQCGTLDYEASNSSKIISNNYTDKDIVCVYNITSVSETSNTLKITPTRIDNASAEVYTESVVKPFVYEFKNLLFDSIAEVSINSTSPIYILVLPFQQTSAVELEFIETEDSQSDGTGRNSGISAVNVVLIVVGGVVLTCVGVLGVICVKGKCGRKVFDFDDLGSCEKDFSNEKQSVEQEVQQDSNGQQIYCDMNERSQAYMIAQNEAGMARIAKAENNLGGCSQIRSKGISLTKIQPEPGLSSFVRPNPQFFHPAGSKVVPATAEEIGWG
ncbi:unnamed protein product [Moneuplotes crassus]|uniref:Uncharacterized protein n=1 Tax=Euplotes crassus TaxID=5936 RepID=A0AAD1UAB2_EUPCR|nr:unnamed protein product [Moneuplotes crassus]